MIKCCDITVRVFMQCMFEGLKLPEWEDIYTEFIDLSGLGENHQKEVMTVIHNLQVRIASISGFLSLQFKFMRVFEMPFVDAFADIKKFGHRLKWNAENPLDFINQLEQIEAKEKIYIAQLDAKVKELKSLKAGETTVTQASRIDFIKRLNRLNKNGYTVVKEVTTAEELALMIKQDDEDAINNRPRV